MEQDDKQRLLELLDEAIYAAIDNGAEEWVGKITDVKYYIEGVL